MDKTWIQIFRIASLNSWKSYFGLKKSVDCQWKFTKNNHVVCLWRFAFLVCLEIFSKLAWTDQRKENKSASFFCLVVVHCLGCMTIGIFVCCKIFACFSSCDCIWSCGCIICCGSTIYSLFTHFPGFEDVAPVLGIGTWNRKRGKEIDVSCLNTWFIKYKGRPKLKPANDSKLTSQVKKYCYLCKAWQTIRTKKAVVVG
jgi:hypothetical protein